MTPTHATAEVFWTAYQALPKEERSSLIEKIIQHDELFEDYLDLKSVEERKDEPAIPIEEYLEKRSGKKAA